mgnify:CR=1 FL=1
MAYSCSTQDIVTAAKLRTLQQKGYTFVGRNLSNASALTETEAKRISDAGIYLVSVYRGLNADMLSHFTHAQGVADAREAIKLAKAINQPKNTYIYFTVAFDVDVKNISSHIVPYFQGVLSVLQSSGYLLGVYASARVCQYICGDFNTSRRCAWCKKNWELAIGAYETWNIKQYTESTRIGSGNGEIAVVGEESSKYGGGGWKY